MRRGVSVGPDLILIGTLRPVASTFTCVPPTSITRIFMHTPCDTWPQRPGARECTATDSGTRPPAQSRKIVQKAALTGAFIRVVTRPYRAAPASARLLLRWVSGGAIDRARPGGSTVKDRKIAWLVAVLVLAAVPSYGSHPRFRRMVVVGDSILAGFGSGGFVTTGPVGQTFSAPAYVARRAGVPFSQPLISKPGLPAPFVIDDANGNGQLDPGDVRRTTDAIGSRARPIKVARNLAVPGEDLKSVFDGISTGVVARGLVGGVQVRGGVVGRFVVVW